MILSDRDILVAMAPGQRLHPDGRLLSVRPAIVIEPFRREALGPNSYDVHLGSHLCVYMTNRCGHLDAAEENNYDMFRIDDDGFVLRPGTIYLAATEEYTETHEHIPYLDGKSSVGRLGISVHATAGRGDVGFCNHWTMEISVVQPVKIYAGMPIAQLTYHQVLSQPEHKYGTSPRVANYQGRDPMPQGSRMHKNFEVDRDGWYRPRGWKPEPRMVWKHDVDGKVTSPPRRMTCVISSCFQERDHEGPHD